MIEELVLEGLREACRRAGNQVKLAKSSGLSQGQLSDYFCGRRKIRNMTLGTLEKLFPELELRFWRTHDLLETSIEQEIMDLIRDLPPVEKVRCLKMLAANFPGRGTAGPSSPDTAKRQ